ncbi:MAG: biotin--[acetyl-CoA-carboxylase] ligase [Planctomycetes bacterium]|nr:biotin--[acetyl-CoA-carboxylase] ligase [Planctomycetota bacterium]
MARQVPQLSGPRRLDAARLRGLLATAPAKEGAAGVVGRHLELHESIDSTNSRALALLAEGAPEGAVVIAEHQTAGRGRLGARWDASPSKDLLFSVILRPGPREDAPRAMTVIAALAVGDVLPETAVMWPNDLFLAGRKLGGVLVEGSSSHPGAYVVGVGLNVNSEASDFPPPLRPLAVSLLMALGRERDRAALLAEVLRALDARYGRYRAHGAAALAGDWRARNSALGRMVTFDHRGARVTGRLADVDLAAGVLVDAGDARGPVRYAGEHVREFTLVQGEAAPRPDPR